MIFLRPWKLVSEFLAPPPENGRGHLEWGTEGHPQDSNCHACVYMPNAPFIRHVVSNVQSHAYHLACGAQFTLTNSLCPDVHKNNCRTHISVYTLFQDSLKPFLGLFFSFVMSVGAGIGGYKLKQSVFAKLSPAAKILSYSLLALSAILQVSAYFFLKNLAWQRNQVARFNPPLMQDQLRQLQNAAKPKILS